MATRKRTRRASNPPSTSLRDRLPFDPSRHRDFRALVGHVKRPENAGPLQIYVGHDRHHYLEIRPSDILGRTRAVGGHGREIIWLKKTASIKEVHVGTLRAIAPFLGGRVVDRHLKQAASRSLPLLMKAAIGTPGGQTKNASFCIACRGAMYLPAVLRKPIA